LGEKNAGKENCDNYYPFGLTFNSYSRENSTPNNFLFNGKEKQDELDLGWYDYGARMYDAETGRWKVQDGKAEYYFATSPYVYALNQPTNAIDPDGNIVIFINGNHFGTSAPGASYWQTTQSVSTYRSYSFYGQHIWSGTERHNVSRSFDGEVMDQLGDQNSRYYDGSGGGWHPIGDDRRLSASAGGRMLLGFSDGARDAKDIIANLARDKSGNIVETIKIVTHSMGGAYGKGFVKALKAYIKTLPIEQQKQILISLVADFDPYQAGDLTADPDIKTMQFIHKNGWNVTGMGGLANEEEQGDKETHTNTGSSTDHSIFSFFNDISKLSEGTYTWDGSKWVKQ
ncbi:MAG TPA: RHS repeat-associated core domain-containing protein, partial [Cyclobacteriaceae bacterium]|nr:RHS repeat-associated core domain-containing protein [Cyclobacteriaceae bacterium]